MERKKVDEIEQRGILLFLDHSNRVFAKEDNFAEITATARTLILETEEFLDMIDTDSISFYYKHAVLQCTAV